MEICIYWDSWVKKIMKTRYCLLILLLGSFLLGYSTVSVTALEKLPYNTIEEAVRASGGTYGVIDTNNPDSAKNFVETIYEQGLTNSDGKGECTSMNIRPGIKISCALSANRDAYYSYEGKKGEKVTLIVSASSFVPNITIIDANDDVEHYGNEQKSNSFKITKSLPYTGQYGFEVWGGDTSRQGEPFTVNLISDKSHVQPDIRKDTLVAGQKYSVKLLNFNQSTSSRKFIVEAYVSYIYESPGCSPEGHCPISLPWHIIISDNKEKKADESYLNKYETTLWLGNAKKYIFEIGKKYEFEVSVQNTSNTNIPKNTFELLSVKGSNVAIEKAKDMVVNKENQKNIFGRIWSWFIGLF